MKYQIFHLIFYFVPCFIETNAHMNYFISQNLKNSRMWSPNRKSVPFIVEFATCLVCERNRSGNLTLNSCSVASICCLMSPAKGIDDPLYVPGNYNIDIPTSTLWFEAWRETFFHVQFPSDHEYTKHFVSCLLIASTSEASPTESMAHMAQTLSQLQNVTPPKLPKWFNANVLRCYVLLHDALEGNIDKYDLLLFIIFYLHFLSTN